MSLDKTVLGPVELEKDLILRGLESRQLISYGVIQTIGGKGYVQSDANDLVAGQLISLYGEHQFTLAQVQALQALAGQEVTLIHHRGTFIVLVVNVPDSPTREYADPGPDDWYSGEIEMILLEIVELAI